MCRSTTTDIPPIHSHIAPAKACYQSARPSIMDICTRSSENSTSSAVWADNFELGVGLPLNMFYATLHGRAMGHNPERDFSGSGSRKTETPGTCAIKNYTHGSECVHWIGDDRAHPAPAGRLSEWLLASSSFLSPPAGSGCPGHQSTNITNHSSPTNRNQSLLCLRVKVPGEPLQKKLAET